MSTETITITPKRSLGPITAQVTIEESHLDELAITTHPVERGAAITDHAYKNPAVVTIRAGWSNASAAAGRDEAYVRSVYADLLKLQESRQPFSVVTGKRSYSNMLMRSLAVMTDAKTEAALMVTAVLQEILIVETQTVSVPPADVHAEPQKTAAVQQVGTVQPVPVSPGG